MKVKIIEANMREVFEDSLNEFCERGVQIKDIKYRTLGSTSGISSGYNYSAMILYEKETPWSKLVKELHTDSEEV